ncbi:hypothetical protein FUAX_47490 (plasmid) [Fulvitalea axinellae]|uniref:Glycoside hydrolase family 19 catalytic domain-containing protein n=1 Tax=Fulvitalea axinellae TaxID=1182444 RepID=A0AAU9CZD6_9BACT|nr:hypothetical protein FUAX_47490 [Fulvitalea axinellae]
MTRVFITMILALAMLASCGHKKETTSIDQPKKPTAPVKKPKPVKPKTGLEEIISPADFKLLLPDSLESINGEWRRVRDPFYTYEAMLEAAKSFPDFCNTGTLETRKRELSAFLANTSHETTGGWVSAPKGPFYWGYYYVREIDSRYYQERERRIPYYVDTLGMLAKMYPPAPGKHYFGRGPIQISHNYNYGLCSEQLGLGTQLLESPELVAQDSVLAFKTAIWFWMTRQQAKPSCHEVMTGQWEPSAHDKSRGRLPGFGMTINIINGRGECGRWTHDAKNRIGFYKRYMEYFGVSGDGSIGCESMEPY